MSPSREIKDCHLKNIYPNIVCCQILLRILFQIWELLITDTMIGNIESKIENLQKCSSKDWSFWRLVISIETYIKQRQ